MMNQTDENRWNDGEAACFRELITAESSPSPGLKARVIQNLTGLGLLVSPVRRGAQWIPWATAAALSVVGFGLGRASASSGGAPPVAGQRYVLLLNGAGSTTPSENAERRQEYGDWLNDLRQRGLGVDGAELVGEQHDFPEPRTGPPVVGYFIITARNESEALSIAETTPHLRHGGGVTVAALR
jgi:hypothetical protein